LTGCGSAENNGHKNRHSQRQEFSLRQLHDAPPPNPVIMFSLMVRANF
jgi:hypothetical protein